MARAKHAPSSQTLASVEFLSRSPEDTKALGVALGQALKPGDVVGCTGELGAGKTTLIQGLAEGLGVDPRIVKSPTFIVMREYAGRIPLIHMDGYRLAGASDAVWLDVDWLFDARKVTAIEWAGRCADCLPEDRIDIELTHRSTHVRALTIAARGPQSAARVRALSSRLPARPDEKSVKEPPAA